MPRVVVIGDVGGHLNQLAWALTSVGATDDPLTLPPDVVVVQVGDLVDRGPDSLGVLNLVDHMMRRQPGQWVQLVGNHEAQYLPGRTRFWAEGLDPAGVDLLAGWWLTGAMNVAAAIRGEDGEE